MFKKLQDLMRYINRNCYHIDISMIFNAEKNRFEIFFKKELVFSLDESRYEMFVPFNIPNKEEISFLYQIETEIRFIYELKPIPVGLFEDTYIRESKYKKHNKLSNEDKSQSDVKYDPQKGWNFEEHKKKSDEPKDYSSHRFEFEDLPF